MGSMRVEFGGRWYDLDDDQPFLVGREGDLAIGDNPYLHRRSLRLTRTGGLWWLENVGSRIAVTVADAGGMLQAWLAPGGRLPLVFARTVVLFTAGPTTYELAVVSREPAYTGTEPTRDGPETTAAPVLLTESQRALVVALAEPVLRERGSAVSIPTSAQAAARLGWAPNRVARTLEGVCGTLSGQGVPGLRGGARSLAVNRRARVVEHAVASRLVTVDDCALLDAGQDRAEGPAAAAAPFPHGTVPEAGTGGISFTGAQPT